MSFFAASRNYLKRGYWHVVIGAIFFMISDGFIAWTKFIEPVGYGGHIIMSTYILAQYLITIGLLRDLEAEYNLSNS